MILQLPRHFDCGSSPLYCHAVIMPTQQYITGIQRVQSRDLERHRPRLSHVKRCSFEHIQSTLKLYTSRNAALFISSSTHEHKASLGNITPCQSVRLKTRASRLLRRRARRRTQMARRPEPRHHPAQSIRDNFLSLFGARRSEC